MSKDSSGFGQGWIEGINKGDFRGVMTVLSSITSTPGPDGIPDVKMLASLDYALEHCDPKQLTALTQEVSKQNPNLMKNLKDRGEQIESLKTLRLFSVKVHNANPVSDKERERNAVFGARKESAKEKEGDMFRRLAAKSGSSQGLSDVSAVGSSSPTSVRSVSPTQSTKKGSGFSR
ncbi:MAG: hypothetical protein KBC27_03135 [Rickettsiales bacterium]|nr:hypothetical protein [Rickettsiales bacterium]